MFKGISMDAIEAKEYFEKAIDKELKFKEYFEKSVAELEPTIMAWIVDAWMENFMRKEGLLSLTKVKGDNVLKRVYDDENKRDEA
jgi:hypothetical protein